MKLLLAALSAVTLASAANTGYNTGYNPCSADNLKETNKYICNSQGDVICMSGWQEPDVSDPYNPCSKPVCDFNGNTCVHGSCAKPYQCECEVGWCGTLCDECVPLPGCQYGYCVNEFDCICHTDSNGTALYEGQSCNEPVCNNCDPLYSKCIKPNECMCKQGWTGADCKTCVPLPGCANGGCARNTPGTCACKDGWTGSLCDQPICSPGCDATRGYCNEPETCKCVTGWGGPNCNQCVKYWTCPDLGNCVQPNQCICGAAALAQDQANNTNVCNKVDINGPQYDAWGPCSNPCVSNANAGDIGTTPGTQSRACNWDSTTATGACDQSVQTQTCFGSNSWTFVNQNSQYTASIPQQCIFVVPATTAAPPPASSEAPTTPSDTTPGGGDANVVDEVVVTSAAPETTATPTTETTTTETTTTTTTTTPTTTTTATDPPITEA